MPDAVWLGEHSPRTPMSRYDVVCIHTVVGFAPAHAAHFSTRADGRILQSRDTAFRSAANLDGNHRVIAIENEDHGVAFGGTPSLPDWVPLTDEQVTACARILAWAHEVHGIPLRLCPDSRPTSRGLAYHRQGIDGNFGTFRFPGRVAGGERWSESDGKVCPTDVRIAQLPEILARARDPRRQEKDMQLTDEYAEGKSVASLFRRLDRFVVRQDARAKEALQLLGELDDALDEAATTEQLRRVVERLRSQVEAIAAAVEDET